MHSSRSTLHMLRARWLPNQFLLHNDAEWGMFKMPFWLLQPFGSQWRGQTPRKCICLLTRCLFCSQLSPADKQPTGGRAHTTGNVIQTQASFKISAKREHAWISVCERCLWRLPCSLRETRMTRTSVRLVLQQVGNHAGTTQNHMIHI